MPEDINERVPSPIAENVPEQPEQLEPEGQQVGRVARYLVGQNWRSGDTLPADREYDGPYLVIVKMRVKGARPVLVYDVAYYAEDKAPWCWEGCCTDIDADGVEAWCRLTDPTKIVGGLGKSNQWIKRKQAMDKEKSVNVDALGTD